MQKFLIFFWTYLIIWNISFETWFYSLFILQTWDN